MHKWCTDTVEKNHSSILISGNNVKVMSLGCVVHYSDVSKLLGEQYDVALSLHPIQQPMKTQLW